MPPSIKRQFYGPCASTVITLIVLPLVTLGVEAIAAWAKGLWTGSRPGLGKAQAPAVPETA